MEKNSQPTRPASDLDSEIAVEGEARDLHPILRDEIYRIAAEALRNAFQHAQARKIEVEIRYDDEQFRLRVRDDGKGIDPAVLSRQHGEGHYGLPGMRERATLIGGKLTVWSEVDAGTEVELWVPASAPTQQIGELPGCHESLPEKRRLDPGEVMNASTSPIRILSVDDHPIVRQGIAGLVSIQPDMILVGEASDGREAIQLFRMHRPDVTLMDLQMPGMNGVDALIAIRNEFPDAKIVVLTTYAGDAQIIRAIKAGAQAYLLKNALHKELLETIRGVHAGKKAFSPEVSYEIATHATDDTLTPAEISVLRLIAAGHANKQIADQLSITEETVKSRVKCILSKLGANDRTQAAMIGLKRGIIDL